eukprot:PITA_20085
MQLVSWNCRGLGNPLKAQAVKNLLKSESPEILMLQETKIEGAALIDLNKVKWKTKSRKAVSARDAYSPKNIILAGDYNLDFEPKEKRGGIISRDHLLPFVEDLIEQWDLLDFKTKKELYTWSNNTAQAKHISACLDRFLLQSTFLSENKIISTKIMPKLTSDHKPILLLFEEEEKLGPIPFQFSPLWIDREGFMDTVSKAWSIPVLGSTNYVWEQKLKATKTALKEWIKKPSDYSTSLRK